MSESFREQVSRLEQMAEDDGETWDLSDNDKAAIAAVLAFQRRCLEAIEKAIAHEDGLDGLEGDPILREAGYWPAKAE